MTSKLSGAFARACGALVLAGAAFGASAQTHQPLIFFFDESLTVKAHDVSSDTGNTHYYFDVPAEAFDLRVSLTNAGGAAGASVVVHRDSPTGERVCTGEQVGDEVVCARMEPLIAGRYFVDATTGAGRSGLLTAAVVPMLETVTSLPTRPVQLAHRTAYYNTDAPTCLETRAAGATMSESPCMPVGNQQQWRFESIGNDNVRIRNANSQRCLAPEGAILGARVVESACDGRASQAWHLLGAAGDTHYVLIANQEAGRCLDFSDNEAKLVHCGNDAPNVPAWTLRRDEKRIKAQPVEGGWLSVARGGLCMRDDDRWASLGDCADETNARYLFAPAYYMGPGEPGDGRYVIASAVDDPSLCVSTLDWPDGHRYAAMAPCSDDVSQVWTLVADGADWQFRNERTGQCLNAKDGQGSPGTRLITWACAPSSDNARWRYLQL